MAHHMATILVKNLQEDVLKELKRLKVEMGCKTWAELLERLTMSKETLLIGEKELREMKTGAEGFLRLRRTVSQRWTGPPTVVSELRRTRSHQRG